MTAPRQLDGKLAGDAGGAQDEGGFSGGQAGAIFQAEPGRHTGIGNGGGLYVAEPIGHGNDRFTRGRGKLSHGSPGLTHEEEVNTAAVVEKPHAVHAGNSGF